MGSAPESENAKHVWEKLRKKKEEEKFDKNYSERVSRYEIPQKQITKRKIDAIVRSDLDKRILEECYKSGICTTGYLRKKVLNQGEDIFDFSHSTRRLEKLGLIKYDGWSSYKITDFGKVLSELEKDKR